MKRTYPYAALVGISLALAACSGNFSSGTSMPQPGGNLPPLGVGTPMPPMNKNGLPAAQGSATPAGTATYPIDQAQKGFACPQTADDYTCTLRFNLPPPTPAPSASPKKSAGKATAKRTASPSPSPSPTPSPSATPSPAPSGSGTPKSASPSASPTPFVPTVTLTAQALPKDAPKMVHVPVHTLDTVALMIVQIDTNGDFPLNGWADAQFTLPKSQIEGRGFAVQLFQVIKHRKSVSYKPIWTFDRSTLDGTTLNFSFAPPKMKIAKGSAYTLVLYGDDKSTASAQPSSGPDAQATGMPSAAASATPSALPPVEQ